MSTITRQFTGITNLDDNNDLSFQLFEDGSAGVDLGLGAAAPSNLNIDASPCKKEVPVQPNTLISLEQPEQTHLSTRPDVEEVVVEMKPEEKSKAAEGILHQTELESAFTGLSIHNEHEELANPIQIDFGKLLEKSKENFDDFRAILKQPTIKDADFIPKHTRQQGTLLFEDEVDDAPLMEVIAQFETEYKEKTTKVKYVDKVTTADRAGKAVNWWTQTFIVMPTSWIFKRLHNGVRDLVYGFLKVLMWVAAIFTLSVFLTAWVNHQEGTALTLSEVLNSYEIFKGYAVKAFQDLPGTIRAVKDFVRQLLEVTDK
ncbi:hypothetical protein PCCS19_21240 [Paenibacillus sp. CCS19]|uniref:hypothetical protein n=1 Tax=Paenibacillus sp. CCS19 TaxID=3158387 RepID=UPI00256CB73E|nr:hypothetical protein [Paenibacillus cellulosilyticus]GMK39070.1 hypothetical protein PCCS19_21240 [Paenibacillus cellulosilyticus]